MILFITLLGKIFEVAQVHYVLKKVRIQTLQAAEYCNMNQFKLPTSEKKNNVYYESVLQINLCSWQGQQACKPTGPKKGEREKAGESRELCAVPKDRTVATN